LIGMKCSQAIGLVPWQHRARHGQNRIVQVLGSKFGFPNKWIETGGRQPDSRGSGTCADHALPAGTTTPVNGERQALRWQASWEQSPASL
jgi:hypothetical protein